MNPLVLSAVQKKILNAIQRDFPVVAMPFAVLADRLNITESEIIAELAALKSQGLIRRLAASIQADKLGYTSTLVAAKCPIDRLDAFVAEVNTLPGVSHNYGRSHAFNVWFTLTVPAAQQIGDTVQQLQKHHNLDTIYSLPAVKIFKLNVFFSPDDDDLLTGTQSLSQSQLQSQSQSRSQKACAVFDGAPGQPSQKTYVPKPSSPVLTADQRALIQQLQQGLPLTPSPYAQIAQSLNRTENEVLSQITDWLSDGLIHRLGAAVNHHKLGYHANAMLVLEVDESDACTVGRTLVACNGISHCYQRTPAPLWPYNLYAMIHARRQPQLQSFVESLIPSLPARRHELLYTAHEYKKTPVRYFVNP